MDFSRRVGRRFAIWEPWLNGCSRTRVLTHCWRLLSSIKLSNPENKRIKNKILQNFRKMFLFFFNKKRHTNKYSHINTLWKTTFTK